jgi:hypothetical protein
MNTQELNNLVEELAKTPEALRELTKGLAQGDLTRKPSPSEFSILENVCHLRDIEREGYSKRVRLLLDEVEPFLPDLNGAELAKQRGYNDDDLDDSICQFDVARQETLAAVRDLDESQLARTGTLENTGPVTLKSLLIMMRDHDQSHIEEIDHLTSKPPRVREAPPVKSKASSM